MSFCRLQREWSTSIYTEVGSALLQRHEAYVSQHESNVRMPRGASDDLVDESLQDMHGEVNSPVAELVKDNAILEKFVHVLVFWPAYPTPMVLWPRPALSFRVPLSGSARPCPFPLSTIDGFMHALFPVLFASAVWYKAKLQGSHPRAQTPYDCCAHSFQPFGTPFRDEHDVRGATKHDSRGIVAIANKGAGMNMCVCRSQFYVAFKAAPNLYNKHAAFSKLVGGDDVLDALEKLPHKDGTERLVKLARITEVIMIPHVLLVWH
ncbi:hypothetical protein EV424DRAFT_1534747 [Suillus variegatus]|nr:hypothetical protein EV424DRAFT_1534747 [Suillus variegatus]